MLSSRACRLPQCEVFCDAVAATASQVSRDALLTGVTRVDVRPDPSLSFLCRQGVTARRPTSWHPWSGQCTRQYWTRGRQSGSWEGSLVNFRVERHLSAIGGMLQIDVPISHNRTSRGCYRIPQIRWHELAETQDPVSRELVCTVHALSHLGFDGQLMSHWD
jgi:hypothetical protein